VAAAQPVRALAAQPRRVRAAPQAQQPRRESLAQRLRPGRDDLALVGIFGGSDGRHALVQLPNGETERVRQGDELRGVQVTAIGADAVHLRAGGRDTVLKLPN
jgi:hypothetical protein